MPLNKEKLGNLITQIDKRNKAAQLGVERVRGISVKKVFTTTKADLYGVSLNNYKIVPPQTFAYVADTSRRGDKIAIAFNDSKDEYLISSIYTTFAIKSQQLLPEYLGLFFNRAEFDRLARFNSWGSARETFDWKDFCELEIEIPPLAVQQKYVSIYHAILTELDVHIKKGAYLQNISKIYLESVKKSNKKKKISELLQEVDSRNIDGTIKNVQGINIAKQFMPSIADTTCVDLTRYKVIKKGQFAYSGMQTGRDKCVRIALYDKDTPSIISPAYTVLEVASGVVPEYLMGWFSRSEFDRIGWFMSDSSIRANLDLNVFYQIEVPIPPYEIQKAVANIQKSFKSTTLITDGLSKISSTICPILVAGALKEGAKL